MRIDAHQHFWTLSRGDYGWLTPDLAAIYRDFTPADLAPLLAAHGIDGTVLVQAAPTVAETEFLLGLAQATDTIKGVVGWVDCAAPDAVAETERLARHPKLKGLRPMIQDIPDPEWMLGAGLDPWFRGLNACGLTFDALVLPQHLTNLLTLLRRHPDMVTVIDHAAKPRIAARAFDDWAAGMTRLARETDAFCKLSGMVTEAAPDWTVADLRPYADLLLAEFGPARLIWGSDWPVCTLASEYGGWVAATDHLLSGVSPADRALILGENAASAYRL